MSGTNDFLPFADIVGADVVSQAAWAALIVGALADGFVDGVADPLQCNKAWRQSSKIASAVAGAMAALTNQNIVDADGNTATLQAQFIAALQAASKSVVLTGQTFDSAVANGNAVRWNNSGTKWFQAIADGTSNDVSIGFADVTNGLVYLFGLFPALLSGLTPNSRYYLSSVTAGAITATPPTGDLIYVGVAKNATDLFVDFEVSPSASSASAIQKITASVGASALTCNYVGGTLDFRSATLGSGTVNTRVIAANSLVVPSGATLGMTNSLAARIWFAEIDNGSSQELAVCNTQLGGGMIFGVNESNLITTTALSAGSTSAGVWYSTTGRAGVPFRLIGYIECTEAAVGTWATAPSVIQGMSPGTLKPGQSVGAVFKIDGSVATGSTNYPSLTDVAMTTSNSDLYMTAPSMTPTSGINTLKVCITENGSTSTLADGAGIGLFQDAQTTELKHIVNTSSTGGVGQAMCGTLIHFFQAVSAAATQFKARVGVASGTYTHNGTGGVRAGGGNLVSIITVEEIMA